MSGDALPDHPAELIAALFPRRRVHLVVTADLDPMPGWGHEPADWEAYLQRHLDDAVGHYRPIVTATHTTP